MKQTPQETTAQLHTPRRYGPGGTVEVQLEGPAEAVADVERFCGEGPRGAHVAQVDARDAEPEGAAGFATR